MPRGGKRAGAGRKPGRTFSRLDCMRIGGHCERLWRKACKENEEQAISERLGIVRRIWAKVQGVPVSDRKSWLGSAKGEEYLEDVDSALCEDQGTPWEDAPWEDEVPGQFRRKKINRVVEIRPKRPKGLHNSIIKQVAKEETRRLGRRVSERMVLECWKEFRRFEKDTDL